MKEYVLTLAVRDTDQPLAPDRILIEMGFPSHEVRFLLDGMAAMSGLIQGLKTPEAVAEFMLKKEIEKGQLLQAKICPG